MIILSVILFIVFTVLLKFSLNLKYEDSLLVASVLILGYDTTASSNLRQHILIYIL